MRRLERDHRDRACVKGAVDDGVHQAKVRAFEVLSYHEVRKEEAATAEANQAARGGVRVDGLVARARECEEQRPSDEDGQARQSHRLRTPLIHDRPPCHE